MTCPGSAIRTGSTRGPTGCSRTCASPTQAASGVGSQTFRLLPIDVPASSDALLSVADRDELDRAFRRLTPKERTILALRYYLGYEPTEIAEMLGSPAGTVRSRLHHAHRAMRAALEADARGSAVGGSA